jgi:serine/threonine protein kinase
MTQLSKQSLGPYEVIAPIGAGGMGEVFRARDTRLSREVAVKVLPADLVRMRTDGGVSSRRKQTQGRLVSHDVRHKTFEMIRA